MLRLPADKVIDNKTMPVRTSAAFQRMEKCVAVFATSQKSDKQRDGGSQYDQAAIGQEQWFAYLSELSSRRKPAIKSTRLEKSSGSWMDELTSQE
jgi:hypothetical protein